MRMEDVRQNRLYDDLAYLWPLVSPPEDYAEEATLWRDEIKRRLGPGRHHLLELGVGGGHNLSHLTAHFDATAVDLSPGMIAHSRRLNPKVEHLVGDMRTVRLGRTFDAVLIHDAIAYMTCEEDLRAAFATAAAHLRPGGLFITSPDWFRETFPGQRVSHETRERGGTQLTYFAFEYDPDPGDTAIETLFVYVIREAGALRVELDRHEMGLFPLAFWVDRMTDAGFKVEKVRHPVSDDPRQTFLLVGTRGEGGE